MYSTCIFCDRSLGRNEVIEHFPVGRRLAFDSAKGRLWAICPTCRRWHLTPIEERWEALEECERVFPGLRTRAHSPEIGAAIHPEGLRLVRVGEPLPVEFAALRYGEAMGHRLRRYAFLTGVGAAVGVGVVTYGALSGFAAGFIGGQLPTLVQSVETLTARVVIPLPGGRVVKVKPWRVSFLNPDEEDPFRLKVPRRDGDILLVGADARRAAGKVMPMVNRHGARERTVRAAVEEMVATGGAEGFLEETWGKARPRPGASIRWTMTTDMKGGLPGALPPTTRLGLEMALQEEEERRALKGELATLEAAWREAEAIAQISDDLLIPRNVEEKLDAIKGDVGPETGE